MGERLALPLLSVRKKMKKKRKRGEPAPVQELLVPEGQIHRRLWLTVLAIVVAIGAFAFGISQLVRAIKDDNEVWVTLRSDRYGKGNGDGSELLFQYDLSAGDGSTNTKKKTVIAAYTELCSRAEALFGAESEDGSVCGLAWLSRHPNETVTVDPALYQALRLLMQAGDRTVFLAPLRADYTNLFLAEDELTAATYDPLTAPDAVAFREEAMRYAADVDAIDLHLGEDGTVCLAVSDAYLTWAKTNCVTALLDLFWLKNAFVVDFIADGLTERGLTYGAISSYDGFTRCLDVTRSLTYGQNLTDRTGGTTYTAAELQYSGRMTVVTMRSYRLYEWDRFSCREMSDGSARTLYLDPRDGICRSGEGTLLAASRTGSCAETALKLAPIWIAEAVELSELRELATDDLDCFYVSERIVRFTSQKLLRLLSLYDDGTVRYGAEELK